MYEGEAWWVSCRAVERELARGLLQLPKEGLSSVVDIVVDFTGGRIACASLLAPCHHAKSLGGLDLPQLGSSLRRWLVTFLSIHGDLACHWLPAYRKWEGLSCACSSEKFFKRGCNPGIPFLSFVLLALSLNYTWHFWDRNHLGLWVRHGAAVASALISLLLQFHGLPCFPRLTGIFGPQMASCLVFQDYDVILAKGFLCHLRIPREDVEVGTCALQ